MRLYSLKYSVSEAPVTSLRTSAPPTMPPPLRFMRAPAEAP
jgi:hypothetical protein